MCNWQYQVETYLEIKLPKRSVSARFFFRDFLLNKLAKPICVIPWRYISRK